MSRLDDIDGDGYLTMAEVAEVLRVSPKTAGRYVDAGDFGDQGRTWFRTSGGHRRLQAGALRAYLRRRPR
jgi:predicted site-specific integrase-resolvase